MRYPAEETARKHERILTEAARLFRERGFGGASVAEIMEAAGLTHGAFYAHFKSKEALSGEAVDYALVQLREWIAAAIADDPDPKRRFLEVYLHPKHRDAPGKGCPFAALGGEAAREPAAQAPFTERLKEWISDMAEQFRWKNKSAARQNSIHLLSAAVGALVLSRSVDDPALSNEILESVRDALAAS